MATNTTNVIKYGSRTFGEIRNDLISLIKQTYPEVLSDFNDSSVGAMLIDLNAAVANNLSINTDRVFQETQLEYAQKRTSLLNMAKNLGFNIPPIRPSVTIVDFTVIVPVLGDSPDESYYPVLSAGAQVQGGGKIFETQEVIDWSSSVSMLGAQNRSITPNFDSNGIIVSYNITKREVVINGSTSIFRKVIIDSDVKPFFEVTLPDKNITEIESVILMEGTSFTSPPTTSDFNNPDYKYYEVDYLAQQKVFVENYTASYNDTDSTTIKAGQWIDVSKKFIKEYTANGFCKLTFGSGSAEADAFKNGFLKEGVSNKYFLENFLNNTALGEKLKSGYTLFIKYKSGGGSNSNIGTGVLTNIGNHTLTCTGSRQDYSQAVIRSLKVNNPVPAVGGNDGLSTEQIRQLIKYNFASQMRDVSLTDYLQQVYKMPGKFGSPFRANVAEINNKIVISIINIDSNGKLSNISNSLLKDNICEYLSQFRMVNDFIEVRDGRIFNLAFDIDVYVDNISNNQIANGIISVVTDYFDINNHEMNEDVFIGKLANKILQVNGVVNVIDIKTYNKVGGTYSSNAISQAFNNVNTGEIKLINNTVYSEDDSMFEIKYPNKDIRVYMRKRTF